MTVDFPLRFPYTIFIEHLFYLPSTFPSQPRLPENAFIIFSLHYKIPPQKARFSRLFRFT
jgi:hypothetical protein